MERAARIEPGSAAPETTWQAIDGTDTPPRAPVAHEEARFTPDRGAHQTLARNSAAYGALATALRPTLDLLSAQRVPQ